MAMIALLKSDKYFIDSCKDIKDFLITYAEYIGTIDMKVFRVLANSNEMSTEELIKYINDNSYSYDYKITEIYEIGKKIY